MKVSELFENSLSSLRREQGEIRDAIQLLKRKGASAGQSGIAPQYRAQLDRLQSRRKAIVQRIEAEKERPEREASIRQFKKERAGETKEEKKERQSKALGAGLQLSHSLRKKYGDWKGLAAEVSRVANQMTDKGKEEISIEKLAGKFGITPRAMYRWFERPEFKKLRWLLPSYRR